MPRLVLFILAALAVVAAGVASIQFAVDPPEPTEPLRADRSGSSTPDEVVSESSEAPSADEREGEAEPGLANATEVAPTAVSWEVPVPDEGAYLGAYAPGLLEPGGIEEWNERTGADLAIAHWYQGWGDEEPELYADWLDRAQERGAIPMVTWEPWAKPDGGFIDPDQPAFRLARIADGEYDDYITSWGSTAAAHDGPIFVRFAHEMNGSWYPWSVTVNENSPEDYVRAWRHVHDLVSDAGADNVHWVWAVNTVAGLTPELGRLDISSFYPGEDYVDWVSVVGFNYGAARPWSVWRDAEAVFDVIYERLTAFDKPIMISEVGTVDVGGSPAAWVRDAFEAFEAEFPEVRAVVWFDAPRAVDIDFRLRGEALEAFRRAVADSEHWKFAPLAGGSPEPAALDQAE